MVSDMHGVFTVLVPGKQKSTLWFSFPPGTWLPSKHFASTNTNHNYTYFVPIQNSHRERVQLFM